MLLLEELFQILDDKPAPMAPKWTEEDFGEESEPEEFKNPLQKLKMMKSTVFTSDVTGGDYAQDDGNFFK